MARKDLSRTVIEGGRYHRNSYQRRASHGIARARTRQWLDQVRLDAGEADETSPRPGSKVRKEFFDKLGPAKRWLKAQVGRTWAKVIADLYARFDTRTIAGRHIVHDHMFRWVQQGVADLHGKYFFVDAHGILRLHDARGRSRWQLRAEVLAWARHRRAANTFRGWWWFRREPVGERCERWWACSHGVHIAIGGWRYHGARYISDARLSNTELRKLERLRPELRELVVIAAALLAG